MLANETNSLGVFGGIQGSDDANTKYATRLFTEIYHRVQPAGTYTLCGLRVSRITSERANTLQLVTQVPNNLTMCKHCERIRGQDLKK